MKITNLLKGGVNATVTFSKGTTNELLVEKKSIAPGSSFLSGPYDFQEVRPDKTSASAGTGLLRLVECVLDYGQRNQAYGASSFNNSFNTHTARGTGLRLLPLPRAGCPRPALGARRGDAHGGGCRAQCASRVAAADRALRPSPRRDALAGD